MKLSELRGCSRCGGAITPCFYRIVVEQHMVDMTAARQGAAMELYFNNSKLARAFDDGEATAQIGDPVEILFCGTCMPARENMALMIAWGGELEKRKKEAAS